MFSRLIQALVLAVFTSSALLFAMAVGHADDANWYLLINVGLNSRIGDSHTVTTGAMPPAVCADLADKLNVPMLLPRTIHMVARCAPVAR